MKVRLALTIGDACGIGPEVILRSLEGQDDTEFLLFGARSIFEEHRAHLHLPEPGANVEFVDVLPDEDFDGLAFGEMHEQAARLQLESLRAALKAAESGQVDAIVTAPWTKALFRTIEFPEVGHTEILSEHFEAPDHVMMLAGPRLRVSLVTTHIAISEVSKQLSTERIVEKTATTVRELASKFGIETPRIAVLALNPHAGEHGAMGFEEQELIEPAVAHLQREFEGIAEISGPHPSDTLFAKFRDGATPYDAVMCMYHDQGLIPLKLMHFGTSANITLGLPIIRTSPDHGSAYDIAGHGVARPDSMRYAIDVARELVKSAS